LWERISVEFIRMNLGQEGNTWVGAEGANILSPVIIPVGAAPVGGDAEVYTISIEATIVVPLALGGKGGYRARRCPPIRSHENTPSGSLFKVPLL